MKLPIKFHTIPDPVNEMIILGRHVISDFKLNMSSDLTVFQQLDTDFACQGRHEDEASCKGE